MKPTPKKRSRSCFLTGILVLIGLIILLVGASATSNLVIPSPSGNANVLTELDKARLAEGIHLRKVVGDSVWPGFGQANIPVILFNKDYAFLVGIQNPEPGWSKVPANELRGSPWEIVQEDTFEGEPYYRQKLAGSDLTPEAFTVLVGDQWVASMTTRDWSASSLVEPIMKDFPAWLHPILPYKLFIRVMLGDSDRYISLIEHEAFHAYEGQVGYSLLEAAEKVNQNYGGEYPWDTEPLHGQWKTEIDYLVRAIRASSKESTLELTRQFLASRDERRKVNSLPVGLVDYERLRELEEGLAKYVQVQMLLNASSSPAYQPAADSRLDKDFNDYDGAQKFLNLEISNSKTATEDTRLYYTGMLQALLLDRLMPEWKTNVFIHNTSLEELLSEAIK